MGKTLHGHFGEKLKEEAERLIKFYKDKLSIDISWREATDIAALRSNAFLFHQDDLKKLLGKVRGLWEK